MAELISADKEWFLPYLAWAFPLIFAGILAYCLWGGAVNLRGNVVSREENPGLYWFAIGFIVIAMLIPSLYLAVSDTLMH